MQMGHIESLDAEGRGVFHRDGKVIFVDGALPNEVVSYASFRKKPTYEMANLIKVLTPSSLRVAPRCPHFGICGGCAMQHLDAKAQIAIKQRVLEDALWHIGRVHADEVLPPIYGENWGYRHRARLSVKKVPKKGGMLVGFHEKRSSYIADMPSCAVLPPEFSALLLPLRELFGALSISGRVPQVEFAKGADCTALVLRILEPLSAADEACLRDFADQHRVVFYLQTKGPETAFCFYPKDAPPLSYALPEYDINIEFRPTDFTQVNHAINQVMVRRALSLLDPKKGERIADMFCGLGNFSLPIARCGAEVVGIEGNAGLVARAKANAAAHGLSASFFAADLFACDENGLASFGKFNKMLIDPPREGAISLIRALGDDAPARIVYVSCNPATLARDAGILVSLKGYRLRAAGVINMFPHTAHVESIAVFEKEKAA